MNAVIKWGDLGAVAEHYVSRPAYAEPVVDVLVRYVASVKPNPAVADVGAGTGKLTAMLAERGLHGFAVEPSIGMASQRPATGPAAIKFDWKEASAEATTLPDACVDWVCMGTAFHWTEYTRALSEFRRILRPGGFFTAIWDLNDPDDDALMREIEAKIESEAPGLRRVQHNIYRLFSDIESVLTQSGEFSDCFSIFSPHVEKMTPQQYLGIWRSYHDVPSQIGMDGWNAILRFIESQVADRTDVVAQYRTHAWTVRAV